MKANIQGIEVEGTPEEIHDLVKFFEMSDRESLRAKHNLDEDKDYGIILPKPNPPSKFWKF